MVILFHYDCFDSLDRGMRIHPQYKIIELHNDWRYGGYNPFVLVHQVKQVSFMPYLAFKKRRTDWLSVMKSQPRVIDVLIQDNTFQENVDIGEGATINAMIEDIGPLVHDSRSPEELDIDVETYFEELQNDETEIQWDSDEDSNKDANNDPDEDSNEDADDDPDDDSIDENDEDSGT
ncbi:hypothetical protein M9H77_13250 [Catharanthus roseus]|uniref:Uncharacterized protein n=1 Tax=Catharanthus roseus TaxID=4058 RepID=A0ACC0BJN2_CATRO|nr:hypothetical protein M9H77_13250 [Catharanthus roseus]